MPPETGRPPATPPTAHRPDPTNATASATGLRTSVADASDNVGAVAAYLRDLIARVDDVPLLRDLTADDLGTPRGTAAIARAALAWLADGDDDLMAERLRAELAEGDRLIAERMFHAHADLDAAVKPAVRDLIDDIPQPGHPPATWVRFYERRAHQTRIAARSAARRRTVAARLRRAA